MGDRSNIHVVDGPSSVYLYSHWGGPRVALDLQTALSHGERWSDGSYLARIIFETMLEKAGSNFTGYGISSVLEDNEYPIVHVDVGSGLVHIGKRKWTFQEYVDENPEVLEEAMLTERPETEYMEV